MIVLGIPRGGVIVASEVARKLAADFDVVIPKKLRAPDNSENAIGALMQDGSTYLDNNLVQSLKVSNEYLELEKSEQKKEIERRISIYRPRSSRYNIKERIVILVDDGAATGATIIAAAKWIRKQEPRFLIIAVPIAPQNVIDLLRREADHVEVIVNPQASNFRTVELFYRNYSPVSDVKVIGILGSFQH